MSVAASERTFAQRTTLAGLAVTLATLPLQWFQLAGVVGLSLRPFHLAAALVLGGVLIDPCLGDAVRRAWRSAGAIIASFIMLLLVAAAAAIWTLSIVDGLAILLKITAYFVLFLVYLAAVTLQDEQALARAVLAGTVIAVALFAAAASWIFAQLGRSFFGEYLAALIDGRADLLQHAFFPVLFNYAGDGRVVSRTEAEFLGTALRNTLVGAFVIFLVLSRAIAPAIRSRGARLLLPALGGFCIMLVLLSVSRSNIAVLALSIMLALGLQTGKLLQPMPLGRTLLVICVMFCAGGAMVLAANDLGGIARVGSERFGEITSNPRLEMYRVALENLERRPFLGAGLGTEVQYLGDRSNRVHNLFLASWFEQGLPGLLASIVFYMALIATWLRGIVSTSGERWRLPLARGWVMALPILPAFRSLISGAGGGLTFIEWLCLALFLGILARNAAIAAPSHPESYA